MFIDHLCHNTLCVNPSHLRVVTTKDNAKHMVGAGMETTISYYCTRIGKWRATVRISGATTVIGLFDKLTEAESAVQQQYPQIYDV